MLLSLRKELKKIADPKRAQFVSGYFKTGKGDYGEGDTFIGVTVPDSRKLAKQYKDLDLKDVKILLSSHIHEERLLALQILVLQFAKADEKQREKIFNFYLSHTKYINNWDLVDLSARDIIGAFLLAKPKDILYRLAKSSNLWEKRIAIIACFAFIRNNQFEDTFKISEILLNDTHDLIHKAVGWMLREVGNRDQKEEEKFLKKHYKKMPRTMLRYAIEKFKEPIRRGYIEGTIG